MAAGLAEQLCKEAEISCAGLSVYESAVCETAVIAMRENNIDISGHIPHQIAPDDLAADRIFCMTAAHKSHLLKLGTDAEKITVLDVSDPYGGNLDTYRLCRDELAEKITAEFTKAHGN